MAAPTPEVWDLLVRMVKKDAEDAEELARKHPDAPNVEVTARERRGFYERLAWMDR